MLDYSASGNGKARRLLGGVRELVEEVRVVLCLFPLLEGSAECVAHEDGRQREKVDLIVVHAEDLERVCKKKADSQRRLLPCSRVRGVTTWT